MVGTAVHPLLWFPFHRRELMPGSGAQMAHATSSCHRSGVVVMGVTSGPKLFTRRGCFFRTPFPFHQQNLDNREALQARAATRLKASGWDYLMEESHLP